MKNRQGKTSAKRAATRIALFAAALIGISAAWYAFGGDAGIDRAPVNDTAPIQASVIADGLEFPWSVAFLPDGSFLVTEREGRLQHISADGKTRSAIAGLPDIFVAGQAGLFDIALSPDFAHSGQVYFSFAGGDRQANNTELARATLDVASHQLKDVEVIFKAAPKVSGSSHYGGRILFTPDGQHLILTLGDRYDHRDRAQTLDSHFGKTVRLKLDGSIPADNPFVNVPGAKPEIYTYGHRNMQGIALLPGTDGVWAHEHGPRGGDEINILKAGQNYGWPLVTYGREYSGLPITDLRHKDGMEDPQVHWTPSIAPSGMAFYTGDKLPQWKGDLFVGALAGQHLRRLDIQGGKIIRQERLLTTLGARIRDVRSAPDGYLYLLTDAPDGQLLRLERKR